MAETSDRSARRAMTGRGVAVVVDDEPEISAILAEYLTLAGFDVRQAANGLEALLCVKRERPRLVLLDLHMPRLGGLDALKRIRAFDPTIKVVVVTGDPDPELERQALALGAAMVLLKPMNPLDLGAVLGVVGPREAPSPRPAAPPSPPQPPVIPRAAAGDILIVDDEPEVRAMLEEFLARQGHRARSVGDAVAALRVIGQEPPDVVLLDIEMPGLSGVEALPGIRAVAPDTRVIMVSGTANVETSKRSLAQGAFDYIVKPIDLAKLAQSVKTAVAMKRAGV
jgi:DNA-binding response OmpR family regulator